MAADERCGARQLRRRPGFTLVAILTLGLGIGVSTTIFSAVIRSCSVRCRTRGPTS